MKKASIPTHLAIWLAMVGICLPQSALAAAPPPTQVAGVADVALQPGGVLRGQVVDAKGNTVAKTPVSLRYNSQVVAAVLTDADGRFSFREVRGGVHQVAAEETIGTYRLWEPNTAPPAAQPSANLVAYGRPVRGPWQRTVSFLSNPWVLAALVATAIAVPIAIYNADKKSPATS